MTEEEKHKHEKKSEEKTEGIVEDPTMQNHKDRTDKTEVSEVKIENKVEEKAETKKHAEKKPERPKKTEAIVNALSLHMSTKAAAAISKFIKGKEIQKAINELEEVSRMKKAIPMKGEFPHRKGKMMSGRFPQKAAKNFIKLLKSLSANANFVGIENPMISEAVSNIAPRPYGKFGAVRRKRTHVKLKATSSKKKEIKKK